MNGEWRPIPGCQGYEVSSEGQVRNARTGRILKQRSSPSRAKTYLKVNLGGRWRNRFVHRLVLLAFAGEPPEGRRFGCRLNDVPGDNRACNLAWGSQSENERMKAKWREAHAVPLLERGDSWEDGAAAAAS